MSVSLIRLLFILGIGGVQTALNVFVCPSGYLRLYCASAVRALHSVDDVVDMMD